MKSKLTLSVDKELVESAKNVNINISDEVENALKERLKKGTLDFLKFEDYVVSFDARNWIVSRKKDSSDNTYHTSLTHALLNLSTRLFKEKIIISLKEREGKLLELNELINLINNHHEFISQLVRGE